MNGTSKQIKWAQDIINKTETALAELITAYGPAPEEILAYVQGITVCRDAKYVIDSPLRQVSTSRDLLEVLAFEGLEWEVTP